VETLSVSIIVTALNEEKNIFLAINNTLKAFGDFHIDGEVIVINDGSTDKTKDIVSKIINNNERVRLINHDFPKGVGASFWEGVDHAKGDIVCWLPGDNENDPWEILRYHKLLEHVDIVIPFVFNKEVRPRYRNALSFIYRFIINTTFLVNFNYTNGTVLYRKSILREMDLKSTGFFYQTEILIRAAKKGYLFAEVPHRLDARKEGKSTAVSYSSLKQVMKSYLRLAIDYYIYKRNMKKKEEFTKDSITAKRYKIDG
jgi:glycosyltransferase involved in cell wall biosynthesis